MSLKQPAYRVPVDPACKCDFEPPPNPTHSVLFHRMPGYAADCERKLLPWSGWQPEQAISQVDRAAGSGPLLSSLLSAAGNSRSSHVDSYRPAEPSAC